MSSHWVFGYGSLIWNPGFEYRKSLIGQIKGYSRRFYQGSDVHRGSPERLGRVVTLIEDDEGSTWGQAYLTKDKQTALSYLGHRESSIGGYTTIFTQFYPKDPDEEPFVIMVYIALPCNRLFLDCSPIKVIAQDIALAKGQFGHNVEYLSKLVAFMKKELPHIDDSHLTALEAEVKQILEHSNPFLLKMFQDALDHWQSAPASREQQETAENNFNEDTFKMNNFKFIDSVPDRELRCIKKF